MSQPTALEQYLLELINAERAKVGAQPLAFDGDLNEAAEGHSAWMIAADIFSHTGSGGSTATQRMTAAGYVLTGSWATGENIAWASTRSPAGLQDEVTLLHTNLMNSSGHRANILNANFREVGLGFEVGEYKGRESAFITEDFGRTGTGSFLTGVAFDDKDGDRFYDPAEGLGGLKITATGGAGTFTTTTMAAGGYDLQLPAGTYKVTFSGPGIAQWTKEITIGTKNVKLDLIDPATGTGTVSNPPSTTIVGTDSDNMLIGTSASETIQGLGGADTLYGRDGNDTLYGGSGNDALFGNDQDDALYGEEGSDTLDGGANNDTMAGGSGDDTYYVDVISDVVIENPDSGADTVIASISYRLGSTVENLVLSPNAGAINGTGNTGYNRITGNSSNNMISGREGCDTLAGGAGDDRFLFDTRFNAATNVDQITDFNDANDTFLLDHRIFTGLSPGALAFNQFQIGTAANELADRIIYDQKTGSLSYDGDGDLAGAAIQFATVIPGQSLSHHDFLII